MSSSGKGDQRLSDCIDCCTPQPHPCQLEAEQLKTLSGVHYKCNIESAHLDVDDSSDQAGDREAVQLEASAEPGQQVHQGIGPVDGGPVLVVQRPKDPGLDVDGLCDRLLGDAMLTVALGPVWQWSCSWHQIDWRGEPWASVQGLKHPDVQARRCVVGAMGSPH